MEFIRQLVAFAIMTEQGEGVLGKSREYIEDRWIICANASTETHLVADFDSEALAKYSAWIDKWLAGLPAAPQEEKLTEEEEIEQAPFLKQIEGDIGAVSEEPKPKKRRGRHVTHDKT